MVTTRPFQEVGSPMKKLKIPFSFDRFKNYFSTENLQEAYDLIKTFWTDVFISFKRGTQEHGRAIKTSLVVCVVLFVILSLALLRFTESSTFCGLCHQMDVYIESWQGSPPPPAGPRHMH